MKKKFAYLLMGSHYDTEKHQAIFETEHQVTYIFTVHDFDDAVKKIPFLLNEKIGAIEICGAFGKENAERLMELTENKIAIGYVVGEEKQAPLFASFFQNFGE